ncbi:type VI secretion protein ImpB [Enterococcus florum]|uniref:Type VI secretion protein ImpB n=1 Tax=Enterococcus florum TaxID=2480627 RepID=A0A4P5PGR8_9ENTE|nr:Y-family DNA polymerase [Enterococcus florum]GCF94852.1 type VI secretion protein ImpB [Enterococcus florum]
MNLYEGEPVRDVFCMDSKSFYASVECVERGLNPIHTLLVVMSGDREGGGLILAASPKAKKVLGISNVSRGFEVPNHPDLLIVPPRMTLYMQYHMEILTIFRQYMADEDIHTYSIDEQFGDLTRSWHLFGRSAEEVVRRIQKEIRERVHIFTSVGLSVNPLLAKVAMDVEAKHSQYLFTKWGYEDVQEKVWPIKLGDFWGIGRRMEKRYNRMGMKTMGDLAHANPYILKNYYGVISMQHYMHAWGIDRSVLSQKDNYPQKEKSIGNSQVLPKNYARKEEIEAVLSEICEQVAQRLRKAGVLGGTLHLGIGYAHNGTGKGGFHHQTKITPTNQGKQLAKNALFLFEKFWDRSEVRNISVNLSSFQAAEGLQLNLFEDPKNTIKEDRIDDVISQIRQRYPLRSIVRAHSLVEGATAINRAGLVGGHAGGMEGL